MKKIVATILTIVLTLTTLCTMLVPVSAASSYDPNKALSYAKANWNSGKGLCAEFVSDCLKAGGCSAYSASCTALVKQLQDGKYGTLNQLTVASDGRISVSANSGKVSIGDPIFFYCTKETDGKPYVHVVLYSGSSNGYMTCYAHNAPKNNEVIYANTCGFCKAKLTAVYAFHMNSSGSTSTGTNTNQTASIKTGVYYNLVNAKSGKYLNVYGSANYDGCNVNVYARDYTNGEKFKFDYTSSGWYTITPACATGRRVNVYGTSSNVNSNICLWASSGHSTQGWILEAVSGGYIIRSANNRNLVLTATGTSNSSNVYLATYKAGDLSQVWKLNQV